METAMTITRDSLMTLEAYAKARTAMRDEVMAQKKLRRIALGEHILLIFENELQLVHGSGMFQCLRIGVGANKFNAGHPTSNHVLYGITARPTDAHDLDDRSFWLLIQHFEVHTISPFINTR